MSLKPWRQVAAPHPDVREGRYHQAEFAADLAQVLKGDAEPEYQDPREFFARTYLTVGMKRLLATSLQRVAGTGGEPVVKLKTAFGGGKTHTMLALYHLLSADDPARLLGVPELMTEAAIDRVPKSRIAVLVGTDLDASKPRRHKTLKRDVRTLWGELAVQIGGKDHAEEAYALVREADEKGVAPGASTLVELLDKYGPCLVLIDELVAYARNIYHVSNLPAGSFDSNMTFIQNLTEAAKRSKKSLVVASIPESNIEIGGEGGTAALDRLEHTFGRLEAVWQPVDRHESFEIVRRRLFSNISDDAAREATAEAFWQFYREHNGDFPTKVKDREYRQRIIDAYPIHPEFFDQLYEDWATLEKFQRTRGVLRLMASVVHHLWVSDDQGALIMPGSLPMGVPKIRDELTRYLGGDQWTVIVDKDVDGEQSEPYRIDRENPRIGALSAGRRVARTIFLGSAPSAPKNGPRGIEDVRLRLGVAQPGENLAIFADALSRLTDRLTFLYHDNRRYWYDTRMNLRRVVEDRAAQLDAHEVEAELVRRLQALKEKHEFHGIPVTSDPSSVVDEPEVRLVVLGSEHPARDGSEYPAQTAADAILKSTGTGHRKHRNMLVFLASDKRALEACQQEIRRYIAWKSVLEEDAQNEGDTPGLDGAQRRQAKEMTEKTDKTVSARIVEAYTWLLVPHQEAADGELKPVEWETARLTGGQEGPYARASRKLVKDQQLITQWSPLLLKMELDRWLWKDKDHISVRQLWEYLTTYLYLPRLKDETVLLEAIRDGLRGRDYFAYAHGVNADGSYAGLGWTTATPSVSMDGHSVLVKPEIAAKQFAKQQPVPTTAPRPTAGGEPGPGTAATQTPKQAEVQTVYRRWHGSVALEPQRMGRDAGRIAEEILAHLLSQPNAEVEVLLEVQATIPEGAPEKLQRTVNENAKTLKFRASGFEEG